MVGNHPSIRSACQLFLALLPMAMSAQNNSDSNTDFNKRRTLSLGIIAFPGFEPLDIFGPLEIFFQTSFSYKMTLSIISTTIGPVSAGPPPHRMAATDTHEQPPMDHSYMIRPTIYATHTYETAPALDILLVPGGAGTRALGKVNGGDTSAEEFINRRLGQLDYLLSVCTGSMILARSGVLDGKKATTNKAAWKEVTEEVGADKVKWVPTARWVVDGNIWTSSGVSAGMDMTFAFLSHLYGKDDEKIIQIMNRIEYSPHTDAHWDPYSVVHKVPGAEGNSSAVDCVKPVGMV